MLKYTLLFLLLPSVISAQYTLPVQPLESKDYIGLINNDSADKKNGILKGSDNSLRSAVFTTRGKFYNTGVQRMEIKGNALVIYPHKITKLTLGGFYNSTLEIKTANRLPLLQKRFVQGSSQNGELRWRGPETGEIFSYGPDINSLEFDGSTYLYDWQGMLVATGTGNGAKAKAYDNRILRTAGLFSQSFNIQANHYVNGKTNWITAIKLRQTTENIIIKENKNISKNLSASFQSWIKLISITGAYGYLQDKFSNSNRNGFLSRVYQDALLTPISFDNSQGSILGNGQRSYSSQADNPYFLLNDNGNSFIQSHHNGSLVAEKKSGKLKFKFIQSIDHGQENSIETYKPGTVYFQNGIATQRNKKDITYFLKASPSYEVKYNNDDLESLLSANYIFTDAGSSIQYSTNPVLYKYQRSSYDVGLNYNIIYSGRRIRAGAEAGNKAYISNTSSKNRFFLPAVSGFVMFANVGLSDVRVKLISSLTHFDSELPIDRSMTHANLLQYSTAQAFAYFPVKEINSFDHLAPVHHREWSGKVEVSYGYKVAFSGEVFIKKTFNDVFPVYENDELILQNIADHRNKGIELQLSLHPHIFKSQNGNTGSPRVAFSNSFSFIAWQNKVTEVEDGYDFTPIAGFSNIHKALVNGQPLGAIVGSSYRKDGAGNMIIGVDGFPLVDNQPKVIGNPIPDFVMKMNNIISWKKFTMAMDWEWRKGGEAWNGTEAMLDYYGRSEQTALLRSLTNYIFPGVSEDGHPNATPVSLYDLNLPVTANRWTRYGPGGVAEDYIQNTDQVRLQSVSLSYKTNFKKFKAIQWLTLTGYVNNLVLWSAYKGADPGTRLLYDQPNTSGLDFFNLPATKTYGLTASIQF